VDAVPTRSKGLGVGDEETDVVLVRLVNQSPPPELSFALASALGEDVSTAFGTATNLPASGLAKTLLSS